LCYGEELATDSIYDVDRAQDAFDLAVARWAIDEGVPLLAICRGTQVVNVACGGTLHQDIGSSHRARTQVAIEAGSRLGGLLGEGPFAVSCHHHQSVATVGHGLVVAARAGDGTIEALDGPDATGFFAAVQWHPEDTYLSDPAQQALFRALVQSASA
jgi:putative glutamine amidotransferase